MKKNLFFAFVFLSATSMFAQLTITTEVCSDATSVRLTGPFWGWGLTSGPLATDNGDGTWTFVLDPAPTANMEYLLVVDGFMENLIPGNTAADNWSCTPITDQSTYANRQWIVDSGDVSNVFGTCNSCADVVVYGCTDPLAFNTTVGANTDDGSCEAVVLGCTDFYAFNYNPIANQDDGSCKSISCGTNLFISEYVEGLSNNKAIELFNPTNETIDLSNYALSRWSNGYIIPETTVLEGSIAPGESFVVGLDKRDPNGESSDTPLWDGWNLFIDSITGLLDSIYIPEDDLMGRVDLFINPDYPGTMYFSGDDAVTLETSSGDILDIIGKIGENPYNDGWADASGEIWTKNKTLIRKASVTAGFVYDPTQPYSFDPSLEWDSLPANTFSNLGIHSINCGDTSQNATTVVDVIVNSPDHTTLAAAVGAAGLVETLSGDGPFTVFAPTDAAFALLPEGTVESLIADTTGALATILTNHVSEGSTLSSDLCNGMMITTLAGTELMVSIDNNGVYIDSALVTFANISVDNGVVHVIDAVLFPVQSELTACPYPYYFEYDSNYTIADISMCITYIIEGCTNSSAENYNPEANLEDGTCVIIGCMSEDAFNYNAAATLQDESCILYGCTNETAENYNDQVTDDDGSCIIYGCIIEIFPNYNPEATVDDLSCNPNGMELYGCIDPTALNFNSQANIDNGSCIYQESPEDCASQIQEESIPLYLPGGWTIFGYTCIEPIDAILGFNNITEQIIIVKDSEGNVYMPEFGFNGIGDLIYSRGYQIKTTEEILGFSFCTTLIVTGNTPQREVGDLAEGGIVFYVDETGQHGLVAALEDLTEGATDPNGFGYNGYEWGCFFENVIGADGQAIVTGYQNTMDIVSQGCVTANGGITAAQAAIDAQVNGYIDWYLPSIDELNEMYNTIGPGGLESNIGGFEISVNSYYWSSSEINNMTAWGVYFDNGDLELSGKNNARRVRIIRAF